MLDLIREHYDLAGALGVWRAFQARFVRRPVEVDVHHRFLAHPVVLRLRTSDPLCYDQVFVRRQYDVPLPPDPAVIVDAGANVGLAAVYFANRFSRARIIALEPEPANFLQLVKNARPYPMIEPVRAALWCEDGTVDLIDSGGGSWAFRTERSSGVSTSIDRVRAVTVDRLLDERLLPAADILKLDVEGAEKEIFDTASAWISRIGAVIAELHDEIVPGSTDAFDRATNDFAYCYRKGENVVVARENHGGIMRRRVPMQ